MSGLFLLTVLGLWLVLVVFIARRLTKSITRTWLRYGVFCMAVVGLFPLIVIDELITAPQFAKLCEEGTKLKFDPEKIWGRTVFLAESPYPRPELAVGMLTGYYTPSRYLDATTKEQLITFTSYFLKGGVLIRTLGISETTAPLMMESYCAPLEKPWQKPFLTRYSMNYVEEKDIK
jgi:hypothetical protein